MGKGYLGAIQVELGVKVPVGTLLATLNDEPDTAA
jgi:pyruvate/2-oxoglutarate dehydrogenase complex dihydrolipoamide acyltransferase (E2) component